MTTKTSYFMGPLVALVALVAALAALLLAYSGASPAHAAGSCSTTSGTTTCTFSSTGSEDTFVVPARVSSIHVVATGAPGSGEANGGTGGRGAQVSADLTVFPGQTLYVNVEGTPTGGNGGFNGGGSSGSFGGGGGGASDVRTISRDRNNTLFSWPAAAEAASYSLTKHLAAPTRERVVVAAAPTWCWTAAPPL
jgi:hypothetical protein